MHFPEPYYAVCQWLHTVSGKPASAPPSGSFKLMKQFLFIIFFLNRIFSRKWTQRFREKRDVHTVNMDQAALDRHKTFTVLLYMMHKYKNMCTHRFYSSSGVFAIKQQSLQLKRSLIYSVCYHWCGPVIAGWTLYRTLLIKRRRLS